MSIYSEFYPKAKEKFSRLPQESREHILSFITHRIHRQVSPRTIDASIYCLNSFVKYLPEEKWEDICQISKSDIRSFVEQMSNKNLSSSTINHHLSILSAFFCFLVDEEYLEESPVLKRYYVEEEKRLARPMKEEDLQIFLENLQVPRDRAMYLLMLRCGLRVSEVAKLEKSHINRDAQSIIIHNGKGKVDRVVYFSQDVCKALDQWLETREVDSDYCFTTSARYNHKALGVGAIQKRMQKLLKYMGLDGKGYSSHTLRHNFATSMLNAGISLHALKELMGHRTFWQTLMYAKLSNQTIRDSYNRAMQIIEMEQAGELSRKV